MSKTTATFARTDKVIRVEITVELGTPLHIGGNNADALGETDLPIIRMGGKPFIPGSSIKGVLRSASERLIGHFHDYTTCSLDNGGCSQDREKKEKIRLILEDDNQSEADKYREIYQLLCSTCRTYGSGSIASKVRVEHVVLDGEVVIRDGIRIDRDTGTVAAKAKFDYEYIEPVQGKEFTIVIEGENLDSENEFVLALGLVQIKQNMLRLGGLQARGLGEIKYKRGEVYITDYTEFGKEELIDLLLKTSGDTKKELPLTLEEYLNQVFKENGLLG